MTNSQEHSGDSKPRRSWRRRLFRWIIILVLVLLFADIFLLPLGVAIYASTSVGSDIDEPPQGFSAIQLPAADGTRLAGWYLPPQNGVAIILLPGAGGTRNGLASRAEMLAANGYGVLAIDHRGAGESEGQTNRFGWAGTSDVGGAVEHLETQPDVEVIGGWGISLGGEILLGAISDYPQIAAVISDGATSRSYEETYDLDRGNNPVMRLQTWLITGFVGLLTGDDPPTPIVDSIRANENTRLLLVAAGNVQDEIDYNNMFANTAGDRAEVWIVPDVGHTSGWGHHRDEYTQRVLDFFGASLPAE
jgi:pimeloyl-ACP methyl ester carboxylesterase